MRKSERLRHGPGSAGFARSGRTIDGNDAAAHARPPDIERSVSGKSGKLTAAHARSSILIRAPGTVPSTAKAMARRWSPAVRTDPRGTALAPIHDQIIAHHLRFRTNRSQVLGDEAEPVTLLDPELSDLPECGGSTCARSENGQEGNFVDQSWYFTRFHFRAGQLGGPNQKIADRLAEVVRPGSLPWFSRPCARALRGNRCGWD